MQKYKVSFKGQNIYVGIDVHLKTQRSRKVAASIHSLSMQMQRSSLTD